jgi:hypothetical protein
MKTKNPLFIVTGLLLCLCACKKYSSSDNKAANLLDNTAIVGRWNVVSDTSYAGVNTGSNPLIHTGQAGDYFDFSTNGNVYTKEGPVLDTLTYSLVSSEEINIEPFGSVGNGPDELVSRIMILTAHNATIASPLGESPGGPVKRIVNLSR